MTGVDPKSILCEFFKAGQCAKGYKCKFSHDLNIQRKGEKIDIYSDKRDEGNLCNMSIATIVSFLLSFNKQLNFYVVLIALDTMDEWDQEMLEKVVESKGKEYNQNKPTDIVYFHIPFNLLQHTSSFMLLSLHLLVRSQLFCFCCPFTCLMLPDNCNSYSFYSSSAIT